MGFGGTLFSDKPNDKLNSFSYQKRSVMTSLPIWPRTSPVDQEPCQAFEAKNPTKWSHIPCFAPVAFFNIAGGGTKVGLVGEGSGQIVVFLHPWNSVEVTEIVKGMEKARNCQLSCFASSCSFARWLQVCNMSQASNCHSVSVQELQLFSTRRADRYPRVILRVMHRSSWYLQYFHVSWFFEAFTN